MNTDFIGFPKIYRFNREVIITEKIDGTNAQVVVPDDPSVPLLAGSRTRHIDSNCDNHGFAAWVLANTDELRKLGPGRHFGEWWGKGIQRGYTLTEKRFSLFNTAKWAFNLERPACCHVVPILYQGYAMKDGENSLSEVINQVLKRLRQHGSVAASGYDRPEGIVIHFPQGCTSFKITLERDEEPKGVRG